jgi:hypothetical protein
MFKRWLGIDGFDLLVHVGITIALMVAVDSAATGPGGEGAIALVVGASLLALAYRRTRAIRRNPGGGQIEPERVRELEARMEDLEASQSRMLELEERVDFAERMLAQQRELLKIEKP